jgi:spore coat polysaccharide biosynthesis protein SpsF
LDTEVCSFEALEQAWREADQAHQREHVMPYLYEHPDRFQIQLINHEQDYGGMRWTVDTAADLALARQIVAHFQGKDDFSWLDVLELMEQHPELQEINAHVEHKHVHDIDERG